MGIKNLNKLLKKHCINGIIEINLKELKNKTIALDTSIFLYKYTYSGNMLQSFVQQLQHLLKYNITPIYIFDGKPTEEKNDLMLERKEKFNKSKNAIITLKGEYKVYEETIESFKENYEFHEDTQEDFVEELREMRFQLREMEQKIQKKERGCIRIDWSKIPLFKQILEECGLFYYQCNGETDIYVKEFFKSNLIDYVITEDLDFLTHACDKVLYDYNFRSNKVLLYNQKIIIEELELTHSRFIDMCILMKCDYTCKISGIGHVNAYKLMKTHESIEEILENINNNTYKKYKPQPGFNFIKARNMFTCQNDINITKKQVRIIKKKEYKSLVKILR